MSILQREYPDLVPMYNELYASRYVKKDYEKRVQEVVSLMRARYGIAPRRNKADGQRLMGDLGPGDPGRQAASALRATASQAVKHPGNGRGTRD
jgi:hypothetical protein